MSSFAELAVLSTVVFCAANCAPDRATGGADSERDPGGAGGASGGVSGGAVHIDQASLGGSSNGCLSCDLSPIVQLRVADATIVFDEAPGPQGIYEPLCGNPIVLRRTWCSHGEGELYALQRHDESPGGMGGENQDGARAQLNLWFEEVPGLGSVAVEAWGNYRDEQGVTWIFERRGGLPGDLLSVSYGSTIELSIEFLGMNSNGETQSMEVEIWTCAQQKQCAD